MKLAVFISHLPLSFLYFIAWLVAAFNCYILRSKRKVIMANMRRAFPKLTAAEIGSLCRKYYFVQTEFLVETIKLLSCKEQWLQKRAKLINPEIVNQVDGDQPILFLSAHQSNWEWAAQVLFLRFGHPFYGVYKPLRSAKLERVIFAIRSCFNGTPLPHRQFAKTLIKHRAQHSFFYVLSDREPGRRQKSISLKWLGAQQTAFYSGTIQLACAVQCAVFYVRTEKIKKGYYEVSLEPIENKGKGSEQELLASYADKLAQGLKKNPENWYWGHPRWRWMKSV
ncbi:MAG: lysophospholipid acyltransferase family protein [Chromatiales bacterium]|nr:lysophospholipid acyltransferase family protein [Chromatiales bacterium]